MPLVAQNVNRHTHEMKRAQRVMESRVVGARIHIISQAELGDPAQALEVRMLNQIEYQLVRNRDESVNRVVENLVFIENGQVERI